uniref:Uncharacterized protein n=1 Tax=Clytia hemisphaerica TaxID=252671 RepID=A0A7M6DQL9_9CNID
MDSDHKKFFKFSKSKTSKSPATSNEEERRFFTFKKMKKARALNEQMSFDSSTLVNDDVEQPQTVECSQDLVSDLAIEATNIPSPIQ